MRISQLSLIAPLLLTLGAASLCSAASITSSTTYYISASIGNGSVTGDIVTDGTLGVLAQSNIIGYNLLLSDPGVNRLTSAYNLTCCNFFPFDGSDLTATSTQLLFNFNGTDSGGIDFADPSLDYQLCFSTIAYGANSTCAVAGETLSFLEIPVGSFFPTGLDFESTPVSGDQAIANAEQTSTLLNFQGGADSLPVALPGGNPVSEVTGTIGGLGTEDYYSFYWAGGAFLATGSITGTPNSGASYLFSEGVAGSCTGGTSETLDSSDSYTSTIAIGDLAAGNYCVGIDADNSNDPAFSLTFDTPVQGSASPEPSTLVLLAVGLGIVGVLRRTMARWKEVLIFHRSF